MPTGACRRALDPVVGMTSGTGCALQRVNSTPLGRRPAIHDFAAHIKESRGWSALADHDELGTVRTSTDAVIARRALIEPAVICITGRCADGIVPRISSIRIAAEAAITANRQQQICSSWLFARAVGNTCRPPAPIYRTAVAHVRRPGPVRCRGQRDDPVAPPPALANRRRSRYLAGSITFSAE